MKGPESEHAAPIEAEPSTPVIGEDDYHFIREIGGEYSGYVRFEDETVFKRSWIHRYAHFNAEQQEVVETRVTMDGLMAQPQGRENAPIEVRGFTVTLTEWPRKREIASASERIVLFQDNFPNEDLKSGQFEALAAKVRRFVSARVASEGHKALVEDVKAYLRSQGWQGTADG